MYFIWISLHICTKITLCDILYLKTYMSISKHIKHKCNIEGKNENF